jgi:DNA-binding NtrC family response regulator
MQYMWPGNVRELKNLVESMVVLSPGRTIRPEDIPPEIRDGSQGSRLLPVHVPVIETTSEGTAAPELEFIFRTLLQLRIDVDQLRHQFDDYKRTHPQLLPDLAQQFVTPYQPPALAPRGTAIEDAVVHEPEAEDTEDEHAVVVFRPGKTMAQLEKEAITAALKEVAGNRRKAAEMLGMGERTLYRKIKEYEIPL